MPGGVSDPIQGYLAFSAIKLVGYSLAALYLNKNYPEVKANIFVVGLSRTIIGMIFGGVLGLLALPFSLGIFLYILGLIPVRLFEWWIIIRWFYDKPNLAKPRYWQNSIIGTIWSFLLDIPAIIGFIATGGLWIC